MSRGEVRRIPAWGTAIVAVLLLVPTAQRAGGAQAPRDEHGAAEVAFQEQQLNKLLAKVDVREVPAGLDRVMWAAFVPKGNATTAKRVALGRKLCFDKLLSKDGTVSCATCHDVTQGLTDQRKTSEGMPIEHPSPRTSALRADSPG